LKNIMERGGNTPNRPDRGREPTQLCRSPRWATAIKERGETPLGHPIGRRCHHRGSHRHIYTTHTYRGQNKYKKREKMGGPNDQDMNYVVLFWVKDPKSSNISDSRKKISVDQKSHAISHVQCVSNASKPFFFAKECVKTLSSNDALK